MPKKIILSSKEIAEAEDIFDMMMINTLTAFAKDLIKKSIHSSTIETIYYDDDIHHRYKDIAYEIFEKLGYEIESDGTDF